MGKFIVFTLIILLFYFAWKIIKKIFFFKVLRNMSDFQQNNYEEKSSQTKKNREFKKNIKWDAETVEYEEIPNDK